MRSWRITAVEAIADAYVKLAAAVTHRGLRQDPGHAGEWLAGTKQAGGVRVTNGLGQARLNAIGAAVAVCAARMTSGGEG